MVNAKVCRRHENAPLERKEPHPLSIFNITEIIPDLPFHTFSN